MSDTTVAGTPAAKPPEFRCELFPLSSAVFRIERTRENGTTVLRRVSLQSGSKTKRATGIPRLFF